MIYLLVLVLVIVLLFVRYEIEQPGRAIIYVLLAGAGVIAILGLLGLLRG